MSSGDRPTVELLEKEAAAWEVPLPPATRDALAAYGKLLLSWRARINITGAKSMAELVAEHLPDAFVLASRLRNAEAKVIDVGSGGGLPALPLALLAPAVRVVLFEPIAKKVAFLRTAIRELGLGQRVRVEARRVDGSAVGGEFDVAISRATFPPAEWLSLAVDLVRPGGRVFALTTHQLQRWPAGLALVQAIPYSRNQRWLTELIRST